MCDTSDVENLNTAFEIYNFINTLKEILNPELYIFVRTQHEIKQYKSKFSF